MSKLKLNIQYFNSTNKTTHYDLSQYVASDKPTYLIDYNQDMSKIDTGIYNAMSKASVNEANIGTMTDLTTTAKNNLVSAINEINTQLGTNTTNIGINTSNIASLGDNQGDLVNLMTTAKNNLVSAINELKGVNDTQNTNISDLVNLLNFNIFNSIELTQSMFDSSTLDTVGRTITVASNSNYSLIKVYGDFRMTLNSNNTKVTIPNVIPDPYKPTSDITINNAGIAQISNVVAGASPRVYLIFKTNGDLVLDIFPSVANGTATVTYIPFVIFLKDFGDIIQP